MYTKDQFDKIRLWAQKRGIYQGGDVKTQFIKLQEEIGEIAKSILKKDEDEFVDGIGDAVVVLTNLAYLGNAYFDEYRQEYHLEDVAGDGGSKMEVFNDDWIDIEGCIDSAYDEIKSREGKMENGTFVKNTKVTFHCVQHRNGYYNLPCKFSEINDFMLECNVEINGVIYDESCNLHLKAKPSINGGVAYVYPEDLLK